MLVVGEWADYDETNDLSVSISELEHSFEVADAGKKGKKKK